jgi:hypothetical protein
MYNKWCEGLICNVNFKNNHMDNPVVFSANHSWWNSANCNADKLTNNN